MAASAQGIRAGLAYVELGVDQSGLKKGLDAAAKDLKAFGAGVAAIGAAIGAVGAAGVAFFTSAINKWVEGGSALYELSKQTGASVEDLSTLGYAARRNGLELADLALAFRRLDRLIDQADQGSASAINTLERLGLTAEELKKQTQADRLRAFVAGLGGLADESERGAIAVTGLGRSGTKWNAIAALGADGLEKLEQKARDFGLVTTTESAHGAHEFGNSLKDLWEIIGKSQSVIGAALAPELKDVIVWLTNAAVQVLAFVKANRELIVAVAGISAALVVVGGAITGVGVALIAIGAGISALSAIVSAFGVVLGVVLSPLGLLAASLAVVGFALFAQLADWEKTTALVESFGDAWAKVEETFLSAWGGIKAALQSGDFKLAAQIAWLAFRLAALETFDAIKDKWADFVKDMEIKWNDFLSRLGPLGEPFRVRHVRRLVPLPEEKDNEIADLRKQMDELVQQAKAGAVKPKLPPPQVWEAAVEQARKVVFPESSRGTFNPFAANALGSSDKLSGIEGNTKKSAKHLQNIEKKLADLDELGP